MTGLMMTFTSVEEMDAVQEFVKNYREEKKRERKAKELFSTIFSAMDELTNLDYSITYDDKWIYGKGLELHDNLKRKYEEN